MITKCWPLVMMVKPGYLPGIKQVQYNPAAAGFFIVEKKMQEQRLIEMETKLAFQETTLQELNDIVTRQQNQLDILQAAIQQLNDRVKSLSEEGVRAPQDEPPPPHY